NCVLNKANDCEAGYMCVANSQSRFGGFCEVDPNYVAGATLNANCANATCDSGLKCIGGKCRINCPSYYGGQCSYDGILCQGSSTNQKYMICENEQWQSFGGTAKITWGNSCTDDDQSYYEELLSQNEQLMISGTTLTINCENTNENYTSDGFQISDRTSLCGFFMYKEEERNIDLTCHKNGCDCAGAISHEMGHNYAVSIGGSCSVESFNEVVGCQDVGEGDAIFDEAPVSEYGETNCKEFFAEAIRIYSEDPCKIKDYNKQYEWLTTHPDSPFYGDAGCTT
ncbi:hypothetical protein KJ628_02760, partial [Patescibacteria group bacterium]|nr:hypothetical protein [Patescibacteria group bacterium]